MTGESGNGVEQDRNESKAPHRPELGMAISKHCKDNRNYTDDPTEQHIVAVRPRSECEQKHESRDDARDEKRLRRPR